jgi:hypothetical protein
MTDCSSKKISSLRSTSEGRLFFAGQRREYAALDGEMLQTDSVDEGQAGRSECNQHTAARSSRHSFRPPSTQDRQ